MRWTVTYVVLGRSKRFLSPKCPEWLHGLSIFLFVWCQISCAEVRKGWSYTSASPYAFMAWTVIVFTSARVCGPYIVKFLWQLWWDQRLKIHPVFSVHFSEEARPCDSLYSLCVCIVMLQWLLWWRLQRWWRLSWSLTIALLS